MKFLLVVSFLFFHNISFSAQLIVTVTDTTLLKNNYKLSQRKFMANYGKDDSSRALIRFFFKKRHIGEAGLFANVPFVALFATIPITARGTGSAGSIALNVIIYTSIALLIATSGFAIISAGLWLRYSRKELLHQLANYGNGNPIPEKIAKSRLFRKLIKDVK